MRILVIDPVVTNDWLKGEREYLQAVTDEGTELEMVALERGPKSIETFHDEAYAGPGILKLVREMESGVDAIMINCFADPAVDAAREITTKVVLGPAETSMSLALHLGDKFSVISTFANTAPWVRRQAVKLGVERRLASAIGVDIPVLDLEQSPDKTIEEITAAAKRAIEQDGAEVIILGCTGMAPLAQKIREQLNVPLIEPAAAALKMIETLVKLGLRHNRGKLYLASSFDKIEGYE